MDANVETIARQRNTFGHRVYDDLCEDLLLWLPIREKLKLRSVSQQFNLCLGSLLKRQRVLDLNELYRPEQKEFNYQEFTEILQRSPNIKEIRFEYRTCRSYNVLPKITAMANNLESVVFRGYYSIKIPDLRNFAEKFGPKLKSITVINRDIDSADEPHEVSDEPLRYLLKCSTQLKSLTVNVWNVTNNCIFETEGNIQKIVIRNLEKLKIRTNKYVNSQELLEIADKNQCLKHLAIDLVIETAAEASVTIGKISELKELTDLKIVFLSYLPTDTIPFRCPSDITGIIAMNLKNLKYLSLRFNDQGLDANKLFNGLKQCSSLISIHIDFHDIIKERVNFDIECIRNCKQLTHLTIYSRKLVITKEFWKQISISFVKLKEIDLFTSFQPGITDNDLLCLSKCKNLEEIYLYPQYVTIDSFTECGLISLVNDCKNLFRIVFYIPFLVTESLHKAMVAKAVKNPDIKYKYSFKWSDGIHQTHSSHPSNLKIECI